MKTKARVPSTQTLIRTDEINTDGGRPRSNTRIEPKLSSLTHFKTFPSELDAKAAAAARRVALAKEMSFVEFSPVSHWLDTCFPGPSLPRNVSAKVKAFDVALDGKEKGMYPGLVCRFVASCEPKPDNGMQCQGFNDLLDACGQGKHFVMKVTGNNQDTTAQGTTEDGDDNRLKPDLVMYPDTRDARKLFTLFDAGKSAGERRLLSCCNGNLLTQRVRFLLAAHHRSALRRKDHMCTFRVHGRSKARLALSPVRIRAAL